MPFFIIIFNFCVFIFDVHAHVEKTDTCVLKGQNQALGRRFLSILLKGPFIIIFFSFYSFILLLMNGYISIHISEELDFFSLECINTTRIPPLPNILMIYERTL